MTEASPEFKCSESCENDMYHLSSLVKSALDQELARLPRGDVSEQDTRYPTDAKSMRAFLEVFFTRHLFQLQNSLMDYAASADFSRTMQSGRLRILDIGSGPAVASHALTDVVDRMTDCTDSGVSQQRRRLRITHVLNDTAGICLTTGKRMLSACSRHSDQSCATASRPQVFTLSTAFPGNVHQIRPLASFLGGFDLVILSYVLRPLTENGNLQSLVRGVNTLGRFCTPRGRMLIIQDKFQERLVRRLAGMIGTECHERTLTQEVYPPRGRNETATYTYYDCLYVPRGTCV